MYYIRYIIFAAGEIMAQRSTRRYGLLLIDYTYISGPTDRLYLTYCALYQQTRDTLTLAMIPTAYSGVSDSVKNLLNTSDQYNCCG